MHEPWPFEDEGWGRQGGRIMIQFDGSIPYHLLCPFNLHRPFSYVLGELWPLDLPRGICVGWTLTVGSPLLAHVMWSSGSVHSHSAATWMTVGQKVITCRSLFSFNNWDAQLAYLVRDDAYSTSMPLDSTVDMKIPLVSNLICPL